MTSVAVDNWLYSKVESVVSFSDQSDWLHQEWLRIVRKPASAVPTGHMWRDPIPHFAPVVNPRYRWFATEGRPEDPTAKKRFV